MPTLKSLRTAILKDPGLRADISDAQMTRGLDAVDKLNATLLFAVDATNVNDDGLLTARDMAKVSDAVFDNPAQWQSFILGHGNDAGRTTGFHWLQNDGGSLQFQGRNFVDTVADAIYHFGFEIRDGRYYNEDGNDNETAVDVAGWLNFFLNGRNVVHGSGGSDELGSGTYSDYFAAARSETFLAGDGDDKVWADRGNDRVYGGDGNDESGGGTGSDRMYGGAGRDVLYGETGRDRLYGGNGDDRLGGGGQGDWLYGGWGKDTIYGEDGYDRLDGGLNDDELMGGNAGDRLSGNEGDDKLYGDDGNDAVSGGTGNDTVSGGAGRDTLTGGVGADTFELWEMSAVRDVVRIGRGDTGKAQDARDLVEGFQNGADFVDLRSLGKMEYRADEFRGNGKASFLFQVQKDGFNELRIDTDGDRAADMIVEFHWAGDLTRENFLFNG